MNQTRAGDHFPKMSCVHGKGWSAHMLCTCTFDCGQNAWPLKLLPLYFYLCFSTWPHEFFLIVGFTYYLYGGYLTVVTNNILYCVMTCVLTMVEGKISTQHMGALPPVHVCIRLRVYSRNWMEIVDS